MWNNFKNKFLMITHLGNLVKLAKQFIKHNDKLLGRTVTGQSGEANNVCIQNTGREKCYHESSTQAHVRKNNVHTTSAHL